MNFDYDKLRQLVTDDLYNMYYKLIYVKNKWNIDKCKTCSGNLDSGETICPYCQSHIQRVSSNMKLSSKRVVS